MRIDFATVTPAPWAFSSQMKTAYTIIKSMLKSCISTFNPGIQGLTLSFQNKESKGLKTSIIMESKQKVRSQSEKQQNGWRLDADKKSV